MTGGHRRCETPPAWLRLWATLALLMTLPLTGAQAAVVEGDAVVRLTRATLQTAASERNVTLPHVLDQSDFAPEGGVVRYRLTVDVTDPGVDRALYIVKMSRSGQVWLNGHNLGSCGPLAMERLRCMHQPKLFRTSPEHWRAGSNLIEVQVFATHRQTNGLSDIVVGPSDPLFSSLYRTQFMLRVNSIGALGWLTLSMGLLAILVFLTQRSERLYGWYGITCMFGFMSNLNILVTAPTLPMPLFDWLIFSTRLFFVCLLGVTYLSYFGKDRPVFVRSLVVYALAASVVIWMTRSDPQVISVLYMPMLVVSLLLAVASIRWAFVSRSKGDWLMASSFLIMPVAGFLDLSRLMGGGAFTGTYILVYTTAVTLALMGIGILGTLSLALRTTRDMSQILQRRVDEREAELRETYRKMMEAEQQRARSNERSRMLQDMHDGFLSSLSLTRVALTSAAITVQQAATYVSECIDDLRLMLEASASEADGLESLLVDLYYRYRSRLASAAIDSSRDLELEGMPPLPATSLLQIMRIVQEVTNNSVRHSAASSLCVQARWSAETGQLALELRDNGNGFQWAGLRPGRGMANMRNRARALGAQLDIETDAGGTRVRLSLHVGAQQMSLG
jgi:signal transduction histidine kinase